MIDSDVSESVVSFILSSHISNNKHDHSIKVYYSINCKTLVKCVESSLNGIFKKLKENCYLNKTKDALIIKVLQ